VQQRAAPLGFQQRSLKRSLHPAHRRVRGFTFRQQTCWTATSISSSVLVSKATAGKEQEAPDMVSAALRVTGWRDTAYATKHRLRQLVVALPRTAARQNNASAWDTQRAGPPMSPRSARRGDGAGCRAAERALGPASRIDCRPGGRSGLRLSRHRAVRLLLPPARSWTRLSHVLKHTPIINHALTFCENRTRKKSYICVSH
jgi:hypothetical protein